MMRVVTSEIQVTGPTNFSGVLPEPPERLDYYRDIAVLAFRTLMARPANSLQPKLPRGRRSGWLSAGQW